MSFALECGQYLFSNTYYVIINMESDNFPNEQ